METMEMQAPVFEALLLFHKEPAALESERIRQALAEKFNGADFTEGRYLLHAFDAAVQIGAPAPFDHTMVSDFIRGQMWNVKDANGRPSSCTYAVRLADDNALTMEYKQRGKMVDPAYRSRVGTLSRQCGCLCTCLGQADDCRAGTGKPGAWWGPIFIFMCQYAPVQHQWDKQ